MRISEPPSASMLLPVLPRYGVVLFVIGALFFQGMLRPSLCQATSATEIKKNISQEKQRASAKKKALRALSTKERSLFHNLAVIEDRVLALEKQADEQTRALEALSIQEVGLRKEYQKASSRKEGLRKDAKDLLATFWPVLLEKQARMRFDSGETWARADREATWLSILYAETGKKFAAVHEAETQTRVALERLQKTRREREQKGRELATLQDDLLQRKLTFLKDVQKIRSQELDLKEQLDSIAATISSLHYKLQILDTHSFPKLKGYLPWPAKGRVVKGFRPQATPPQRGISLALTPQHAVTAVSWGKVVHEGQLRGFGRVVILYHGKDYYSLYAFLATSRVHLGQKVEKGETLGECGFYPLIRTSGLYFELRFHQKAINPLQWLQSMGS